LGVVTSHDLVMQWFAKHQDGVPGDRRYITIAQLDLLRKLIEQDEEGAAAVKPGRGRSFVWAPSGRTKFVITEGEGGRKNTIVRMMDFRTSGAGMLFGAPEDGE
jgi:hypothetical protein